MKINANTRLWHLSDIVVNDSPFDYSNLMAKEEWRNLGYPEFDEKLQNENKS